MAKRNLGHMLNTGTRVFSGAIAATTTSSEVDLSGNHGAMIIHDVDVCTDGGYTISYTSASASGGTFAADTDIETHQGSTDEITSSNDDFLRVDEYVGANSFLKVVVTESTSGVTGVVLTTVVIPTFPRHGGSSLMD